MIKFNLNFVVLLPLYYAIILLLQQYVNGLKCNDKAWVKLSPVFGDNMVLQRAPQKGCLYGTGIPGLQFSLKLDIAVPKNWA